MYMEVVHGFVITWGSEELGDKSSIRDQREAMCYQTSLTVVFCMVFDLWFTFLQRD